MTLVISTAVNGFENYFSGCIESHKKYCIRYGFEYRLYKNLIGVDDKPYKTAPIGKKAGCSKIKRFLSAFDEGFEKVLWLDVDCFAMPNARDFREAITIDGVFLIKNCRENFDGGIIIAQNDNKCKLFFQTIWDNFGKAVPTEYMRKYECGHLLYYGTGELKNCVNILDNSWLSLSREYADFRHNHKLNENKNYNQLLEIYNAG